MTWINQINMNGSMICMEISFLLVSINAISYLTYLNIIKKLYSLWNQANMGVTNITSA